MSKQVLPNEEEDMTKLEVELDGEYAEMFRAVKKRLGTDDGQEVMKEILAYMNPVKISASPSNPLTTPSDVKMIEKRELYDIQLLASSPWSP